MDSTPEGKGNSEGNSAVWVDDDDSNVNIDVTSGKRKRLRKLDKSNSGPKSGAELSALLKDRFQTSTLDWATEDVATGDNNTPEELLQTSASLTICPQGRSGPLPSHKINMLRQCDANIAEPSTHAISATRFHQSKPLLLVTGQDRYLRFFNIDGDKNEKVAALRFNDMAISNACFLGSTGEAIVVGRKPYYYSFDSENGTLRKIPGILGKPIKSHEHVCVSPTGDKLAFGGSGGYVHICCGQSKSWIADVKMNSPIRSSAFLDSNTFVTSGLDADIYWWDLRMASRCLHRYKNEDGSCSTALAVHNSGPTLAVGSESGVVSIYGDGDALTSKAPHLSKSLMNLTTRVDTLEFHPSGQLLAIGSSEKNDQLRLVHLPSMTVFSNWPSETTPIRKLQCCSFSPGGGYFAIGSSTGKVLLYRVQHFDSC